MGGTNDSGSRPKTPAPRSTSNFNRRSLLLGGAAGLGATFVAVRLSTDSTPPEATEDALASASEAITSPPTDLPTTDLPTTEFDGTTGISAFTTPTSEHYVIDVALEKPVIDSESYTLTVGGPFVARELTLSYADLLAREHITRQLCLAGVSNPVGGDLVGNAVWTGVSLTELLDEAGIDDPTNPDRQIFSMSVDGYSAGFRAPLAYDGRTAMVALAMNGEPLPVEHGFPARLLVNGLYGYTSSTKWLERIEVNDFATNDGFWIPRGWAKEAPVKTQSRIDSPSEGSPVLAGPNVISGVAWAPGRGIAAVEVGIASVDDSESIEWVKAELGDVESVETWVQWRSEWDAPEGDWILRVRATNGDGITQSEVSVPAAPDGAEGHHTIVNRIS